MALLTISPLLHRQNPSINFNSFTEMLRRVNSHNGKKCQIYLSLSVSLLVFAKIFEARLNNGAARRPDNDRHENCHLDAQNSSPSSVHWFGLGSCFEPCRWVFKLLDNSQFKFLKPSLAAGEMLQLHGNLLDASSFGHGVSLMVGYCPDFFLCCTWLMALSIGMVWLDIFWLLVWLTFQEKQKSLAQIFPAFFSQRWFVSAGHPHQERGFCLGRRGQGAKKLAHLRKREGSSQNWGLGVGSCSKEVFEQSSEWKSSSIFVNTKCSTSCRPSGWAEILSSLHFKLKSPYWNRTPQSSPVCCCVWRLGAWCNSM